MKLTSTLLLACLYLSDKFCDEEDECAIPGLEGHYLEFLGLLTCPYRACERKDIPAKHVSVI